MQTNISWYIIYISYIIWTDFPCLPAQTSGGRWLCPNALNLQGLPSLAPVATKKGRFSFLNFIFSASVINNLYLKLDRISQRSEPCVTYRVFTEVLVGTQHAFLLGPSRHYFRVRNHNPHQTGLQRANDHKGRKAKDFTHEGEHVFYLSWFDMVFKQLRVHVKVNRTLGYCACVCESDIVPTCRLSPWTYSCATGSLLM